jgi:hypothetical protein
MDRYLVKLNYNVVIGGDASRFEEQLSVLDAYNAENAVDLAIARGRAEDETFVNHSGEKVEWVFVSVSEVINVTCAQDGDIIMSRSFKKTDARSYSQFLEKKELAIQAKNVTFV